MKSNRTIIAWLLAPSALFLFVVAFQWTLIGWLTPFLYPMVASGAFILLIITSLVALVRLFWKKAYRQWPNYLPLLAAAIVVHLALYFPFTDLWLKANFILFRHARESIAADFLAGKYAKSRDGRGDIHLSGLFAGEISEDDGRVEVFSHGGQLDIYFFTYCGVLGHSTGYYYAPSDIQPPESDYFHVVKHIAPRWYLVQTE